MNIKYTLITFGICCLLTICLMEHCSNNPTKINSYQKTIDSLNYIGQMKDYQYGILLVENHKLQEKAAIKYMEYKEREPIYIERIKYVYKSAPDTCHPYLTQLQSECDTLIDLCNVALESEQTAHKSTKIMLDNRNERIYNDSVIMSEKNKHIDNLRSDNNNLERKSNRNKKIAKVMGCIAAGAAAILTATFLIK